MTAVRDSERTPTPTQDLGHGITLIDTGYLHPGLAAVYLIRSAGRAALIETGTARTLPRILDALERLDVATDSIDYIVPTHVHLDHAGGAGQLMAQCPRAQMVVHPAGARHLIDPSRLIQGAVAVYGEQRFRELYGDIPAVDADRVVEAPDGLTLELAGRLLHVLDTPGHARHHLCLHDPDSDGIFTGDAFGLSYPALATADGPFVLPTTTPVQFDPEAMLASIDRLLALAPTTLFLTHFGPVRPDATLVGQLKRDIDAFTRIALEEATPQAGRAQRIEHRLLHHLLDRLTTMGGTRAGVDAAAWLALDVGLNAQGLDIWLSRHKPGG